METQRLWHSVFDTLIRNPAFLTLNEPKRMLQVDCWCRKTDILLTIFLYSSSNDETDSTKIIIAWATVEVRDIYCTAANKNSAKKISLLWRSRLVNNCARWLFGRLLLFLTQRCSRTLCSDANVLWLYLFPFVAVTSEYVDRRMWLCCFLSLFKSQRGC